MAVKKNKFFINWHAFHGNNLVTRDSYEFSDFSKFVNDSSFLSNVSFRPGFIRFYSRRSDKTLIAEYADKRVILGTFQHVPVEGL